MRPALAALADPRVGAPAEGPGRDRARELLDAAAGVLDAAARSIRRGAPAQVPSATAETLRLGREDGEDDALEGPAPQAAVQLSHLLTEALEIAGSSGKGLGPTSGAEESPPLLRPTVFQLVPIVLRAMRRELRGDSPVLLPGRGPLRRTLVGVAPATGAVQLTHPDAHVSAGRP